MSRHLLIVRHAQTQQGNHGLSDQHRELTQEGITQATLLGKFLNEGNHPVDLILSSNAARAKSTALFIATAINYPLHQVMFS